MGIVSKIYFGISHTITTDSGKLITGFAYGIGASIVIIGALFKILHLKGAEEMLMLGMGAEAFLFALGSFEPPHKEYDWSLVYPVLAMGHGHMPGGDEVPPAQTTVSTATASVAVPTQATASLNVDVPAFGKDDAEMLSKGIKKLSDTAAKLNDLSDATLATDKYISSMESASSSVDALSKVHDKGTEAITSATDSIVQSYQSASESLKTNIESINGSSAEMQESVKGINNQLGQINSVYELQLNSINELLLENKAQIAATKSMNTNLAATDASVKNAANDMAVFSDETVKLKQQITDLNAVYGNMLNALNVEA